LFRGFLLFIEAGVCADRYGVSRISTGRAETNSADHAWVIFGVLLKGRCDR
jgi:hypothetical protein